jgi:Na+-transporting NADH:ubiquinone oxidoreductase subunit F
MEVERSTSVSPTVKIIRLRFKDGGRDFRFEAGQFISVRVEKDGSEIIKPYSMASPPSERGYIELLIKRVQEGFVSNYMHELEVGEELEIRGPAGLFVLDRPFVNDLIFVATGSGLSTIRSMLSVVRRDEVPRRTWLFYGVRTEDELVERSRWEEWESVSDNFRYMPVLSRGGGDWGGERGYVQDALIKYVPEPGDSDIYICGLWKMVEDVVEVAKDMGFPLKKIHYERFV